MSQPSGTYFTEEQNTAPAPTTLTDPILLCQGVTERGPLGPLLCKSDTEFFSVYGGYTADNFDTLSAVQQYFDNGGRLLVMCRVVHCTDPTNPLTATCAQASVQLNTAPLVAGSGSVVSTLAAPFVMHPADTLAIKKDGAAAVVATFNAAAAIRQTATAGPYTLADGQQLTLSIAGGAVQTVTFSASQFVTIAAATATEVCASINGQITGGSATVVGGKAQLQTDAKGTAASLNVTGGNANVALAFTTGVINGTGNVANIAAVTGAEVASVVQAAVAGTTVTTLTGGFVRIASNTTGTSSSIQIDPSSVGGAADLGFDNALHSGNAAGAVPTLLVQGKTPGAYANQIQPIVAAPTSGAAGKFNLYVQRAGVIVERFTDLSMVTTDAKYAPRAVNDPTTGSALIMLTDLFAASAPPANIPAQGTFGPMTGGVDGLVGLNDNDFIGGVSSSGSVGLRQFDTVDGDLLMSPQRATPAVAAAIDTYCEVTRLGKIYPIYDMPKGYASADAVNYVQNVALLYELTELGCIDWPRIKVTNPNKALYGDSDLLVAPASGTRAGICARVESAREAGVFDQPGGPATDYLPKNVRGLETDEVLNDTVRGNVFDANINPITRKRSKKPGANGQYGPIYFDGVRNLKRTGNWPSIGQRRGIIWVKKQLDDLMDPTRHRNITDALITNEQDRADSLMRDVTRAGALASTVPAEAYILDWGPGRNTAATRKAGQTNGRVGLATTNANEFIFITIGPDNRQLQAQLAAAQ